MKYKIYLVFVFCISFIFNNTIMANTKRFNLHQKENIHKIWKFKSMTPFGASFRMQKIDLLDLRNKDSLTCLVDGNKESQSNLPYKIINNTIILQVEDKGSSIVFIISELTINELKLIVHATFVKENGEKVARDLCELTFEAEE